MRVNEDGEDRGRGQSLLALGEALNEPAPAGPSRLAAAIAQVRAERGMAPPKPAPQPTRRSEPDPVSETGPTPTPAISPLLQALASDGAPSASPVAQAPPPGPAEDWPRERSTGAVPPLLASASQWPQARKVAPARLEEPEAPPPSDEIEDADSVDEPPPASPVAAAAAAVKAVRATRQAREETPAQPAVEPEPPRPTQEKLPFPEPEPLPLAQPTEAFWDDAARVLGLEDETAPPARSPAARPLGAAERTGKAARPALPELAPQGLVAGLRRSTKLILATTLAGTLIGGAWAVLTPRTYTSTAELLADGRGAAADVADAQKPTIPDEALRAMVEDQLRVLRSQSMLTAVADRLKLADDPEFDGTADGLSLSTLAEIISGAPGTTDPERRRIMAEQALARSLDIARSGASFVIDIRATTRDADKSALIANTVAETFLAGQGRGGKAAVRVLGEPATGADAAAAAPQQATRIISRAMPALASNPPSRLSIVLKGLALGLFAGLGLAMLRMLRERFAAPDSTEHVAAVPAPRRMETAAPPPMPRQGQTPPRAASFGRPDPANELHSPTAEFDQQAHPAPPEDSTMQRAPYRRSDGYDHAAPAGQHADPYRSSPLRQPPRTAPAHEPWDRPGHVAYGSARAGEGSGPRDGFEAYDPYWQKPAAPQHRQQPYQAQQQMLHPRHQSMWQEAQDRGRSTQRPAPQHRPYAPEASRERYREFAQDRGYEPGAYPDRAFARDDYPPNLYRPAPEGHGPRYPRQGERLPPAYAGHEPPRESGPDWRDEPRQPEPSIDEIRATLRECREAIRDLSDRRTTRRRYF